MQGRQPASSQKNAMQQMMDILNSVPADECLVTGASAGGKTALVVALPHALAPRMLETLAEGVATLLARVEPALHLKSPLDHIRVYIPALGVPGDPRQN